MSRMYDALPLIPDQGEVNISMEIRADIDWWKKFIEQYNGVSIMWMEPLCEQDYVFTTDACLTGIGGFYERNYFHKEIPKEIVVQQGNNIAHLEMLALMVAL